MIRWESTFTRVALVAALVVGLGAPAMAKGNQRDRKKIDRVLTARAGKPGTSRVIIRLKPGADASGEVKKLGGRLGRRLTGINGQAIELPNVAIRKLAERSEVLSIHYDRPTGGELNRAAVTVGARAAQFQYGYTGAGVGVAVIDSGITSWHDDLTYLGTSSQVRVKNEQRVAAFVDFVNGRTAQYDDNGHGSHVAGIIAGNGYDSFGTRAGIAPSAHLLGLKVLDDRGRGVISDVIAALDWVVANRGAYNIRVVNLSVGAAVTESYLTDPLTLAAKRAVDSGVVVVTAAGNLGKNRDGQLQYGGITAPGNAPWVLTVGAFSHEGTIFRFDDVMAGYSSRGPSAIDYEAKPDVVAPGTGIVSLADMSSTMYTSKSAFLMSGSFLTPYKPYLSLTGTSMAAPVVSGTIALMLQANPSLTPNMVKAILQYTAQRHAQYNPLTQGAGFLNTYGAVQLARFYRTAKAGDRLWMPRAWSRQILWGNNRIKGGVIRPNANAFQLGTTWGAAIDGDGDNIVWGTLLGDDGDNIVWGTFDALGEDNIVWGTLLDGGGDNIVWGTHVDGDNIVWGTLDEVDNIVWGTACGGADCDNIVWGTSVGEFLDNIVWGTLDQVDNIVWGTTGEVDNIVWGTASETDNTTWGNSGEDTPLFDDPNGVPADFDQTVWEVIFPSETVEVVPAEETSAPLEPVTQTLTPVTAPLTGGLLGGL
ncbi:MAG: S8 family peptidase [Vicinamibacterales bacterium]